ncbi:MAG: hybrid sensor histidine kinase/response regulator, partial [Muribaculaceae bacterium]|nr:hybrid sensor histidine kinase/response regulator [Muribaculaceae bacterium]
FRFDGDSLQRMPFREKYEAASVNDVFTVISEGEHIWAGTGHGLIKSGTDGESLFFGAKNGFTNNTIHDILADNDGCFWISTNNGLIKFNPETNHSQVYNRNYGLTVAEFSDGASFRSEKSLMFGGVDGFVVITKTPDFVAENAYIPALTLQRLNILGQNVNPNDHITRTDGHNTLTLDHTQNHFSVKFVAPDFIDASNYSYLYTLDGKDWINNGDNPVITFNGMEYGNYTLGVKYLNRTTGMEGHPCILDITIRAPWYLSTPAKCIYILLLAAMAFGAIRIYIRRQKERQEKELARIEHTHREELYEEKLKFFTNITHEFCTPITLIYGPCERILNYDGADDYIKKYVGLIRGNAERLNTLIQELIDFRRMETGHKTLKIRSINITEICEQTIGSGSDRAERNNIGYTSEITPDVTWNSDFSGLRKILNNLISNAFKYTPVGGDIKVGMDVADNNLRIFVYNTGKGLREEDKKLIFNRYSVFDNVDGNAVKGLSSRNGLGMAICHS